MALRIAINGFGRIGRLFLRCLTERDLLGKEIEVAAITDTSDNSANLAYLLKHDSIHGRFQGEITADSPKTIRLNKKSLAYINAKNTPLQSLPWKNLEIDYVLEATGVFNTLEAAEKHLEAGARRVVIAAPASGAVKTIVMGVNEDEYEPHTHRILSNASCTTNCIAPVLFALSREKIAIKKVLTTTIHSYTASQKIMDGYSHPHFREGRGSGVNIIPFHTKSPSAAAEVLPFLSGKVDGISYRVPVQNIALVDFALITENLTTIEQIDGAMRHAANSYLKNILKYETEELVSSDFIHEPYSAIYDSRAVLRNNTKNPDNFFKLIAWYDNEWGYVNRLADLILFISKKD